VNKIKNLTINPTNGGKPALEKSSKVVSKACVFFIKNKLVQVQRERKDV